jgi:hypothetical protein
VFQTARRSLVFTCWKRLRTAEPTLGKDVGAQGALKEHTYERSNQAISGVWLRSGTAGVGGWDRVHSPAGGSRELHLVIVPMSRDHLMKRRAFYRRIENSTAN